jgi:hypothetical protein
MIKYRIMIITLFAALLISGYMFLTIADPILTIKFGFLVTLTLITFFGFSALVIYKVEKQKNKP